MKYVGAEKDLLLLEENHFDSKYTSQFEYDRARDISWDTGVPKSFIWMSEVYNHVKNWYFVENDWYYYKCPSDSLYFLNEMLGEVLAEYFRLRTTHYQLAKLYYDNGSKVELGIASKNFCVPGHDYRLIPKEMKKKDLHIEDSVMNLCSNGGEYQELLTSMKKNFIFSFYMGQSDQTRFNFLLEKADNKVMLAPLFDYEYALECFLVFSNGIGVLDIRNIDTKIMMQKDDVYQESLERLMQLNMKKTLQKLEDYHQIKFYSDDKECWINRDKKMKQLIKINHLIK